MISESDFASSEVHVPPLCVCVCVCVCVRGGGSGEGVEVRGGGCYICFIQRSLHETTS